MVFIAAIHFAHAINPSPPPVMLTEPCWILLRLLRWRTVKYAVIGDVEKHQIQQSTRMIEIAPGSGVSRS